MSTLTVAVPQMERYHFNMKTKTTLSFLVGLLSSTLAIAPASAAVGDWVAADVVQVRLVASLDQTGAPAAALEIRLNPGWKTYWRTPGEGGLPTVLDFGASRNLASATAAYPAPRRYDDGYSVTNVYEGRVLFPIDLTAALPTAPVTLAVQIDMGVCEEICIPLLLEASVELVPEETDAEALAIIDEARSLLPGAPQSGTFEIVGVTLVATDSADVEFTATAIVPQAFGTELFVEGPVGWYPAAAHQVARDGNRLTFAFAFQRPAEGIALPGTVFTFTLVSAGGAIEQTLTLP